MRNKILLAIFAIFVAIFSANAQNIMLPAITDSISFTNPSTNKGMSLLVDNTTTDEAYTKDTTINGVPCRKIPSGKFMYISCTRASIPTSQNNLLIAITYYANSNNNIWFNYNGTTNNYSGADFAKTKNNQWVTSVITLTDAAFNGLMSNADFRMGYGSEDNYIKDIKIYVGTLNPLSQPIPVSPNSTSSESKNKSFAGYQIWHKAGAAAADWVHWSYGVVPSAGFLSTENIASYPAVSEFPDASMYATNFANLGNGTPAKLYNDADSTIINKQINWLKTSGLDGVAIQRFVGPIGRNITITPSSALTNVKKACEANGRLFYICYDLNGIDATILQRMEMDWVFEIEQMRSLTSSPNYATVNGKPVVEMWGVGVNLTGETLQECLDLTHFLQSRGCYVIGGVPRGWRTNSEGALPAFDAAYNALNCISPWTVGVYSDTTGANNYLTTKMVDDKAYCTANGKDYLPVAFAGSSNWLSADGTFSQTNRLGGKLLWKQVLNAKSIGQTQVYYAMLDEFEEGTNLIKGAVDYFDIPTDQYFETFAKDGVWVSPDYYLRLAAKAAQVLRGDTLSTPTIPINLSNGPIYYRNSFESRTTTYNMNSATKTVTLKIDPCFYNDAVIINTAVTTPLVAIVQPAAGLTKTGLYSTQITGTATGASKYYYQVSETKIAVKANMQLSFWKYSVNTLGQNTAVDLIFKSGKMLHNLSAYTDNNSNVLTPTIARGTIGTWQKFICQIGKGELIGDEIDGVVIAYENATASGNFNAYFDDIIIQDALDTTVATTIPSYTQITTNAQQFTKVEFAINIAAPFTNGYDATQISLDMIATAPSGLTVTQPCFYNSGNSIASSWSARFTPKEVGNYTYAFRLNQSGTVTNSSQSAFTVTATAKDGFLHTVAGNNWIFKFDDGKPFKGIGEDYAWQPRNYENQKYVYAYMLPKLAANGANFFRTWMCPWNLPLEWKAPINTNFYTSSTQYFNPSAIAGMDSLVNLSEANGMYMMLTLNTFGDLIDQWNINNYNVVNGGPCNTPNDFFALTAAKTMFKNRLRYIVARWGYSSSIAAVELFNEIDNAVYGTSPNLTQADVTQWHKEMSAYLKSIDPNGHMVTTSVSYRDITGLNAVSSFDFNQQHIYSDPAIGDVITKIPTTIRSYDASTSKPYSIGEYGYDWRGPDAAQGLQNDSNYKRGLWYGIFSPTPIAPMSWWWEMFDDRGTGTYIHNIQDISNKMIAAGGGVMTDLTVSGSTVAEKYGALCGTTYFVYARNSQSSNINTNLTIPVTGAYYDVSIYNTTTGAYTDNGISTTSAGTLTLPVVALGTGADVIMIARPAASAKPSNGLNYPALLGYWQNWDDVASPYIPLDQVDSKYNNVIVAFATPDTGTTYKISFTPYNVSQATFISQIQTLQSQGRKVLISIGGEGPSVTITTAAQKTIFINSVESILNTYGFDGVDIDFEGSSLSISGGTIAAPTDAAEINLIAALKQIMQDYRSAHNNKMLLTMAPEAANVQGGMSSFGGIWGSYLPVISGLKDSLDVLQVQLYNTGTMYGIDGKVYTEGTADFIVAETEAAIKGFSTAGGLYGGLPANKVAVGLPSCAGAAGGGFTDTATVHAAMNYLLGKGPKPGTYTLQQSGGYPTLEGMMDWSINYDKICSNNSYATNFQNIFNSPTPASAETPYGGTPWPIPGTIQSEDYDNGGQGIAYNDVDATNNGGQYRPTEGVDVKTCSDGGFDVGWTAAGEWMKYSVNVVTPGVYTMLSRVASTATNGAFHVTMDGTTISGTVTVPNTGSFQYWQTLNTTTTYLTAGLHTMEVLIDVAGFNINYLSFVGPITSGLTVTITAPINNVNYNDPATIPIVANASTNAGTITMVEFFANGTKIGQGTTAPYTYNWVGVAAGTYSITAKVTNSNNATTLSLPVSVTVKAAIPNCPLLTWSDEFNGNSLDANKWGYQNGNGCPNICGWGNNELEYYTNNTNNVSVAGGALAITAQYQPNYNGSGNNYTSGKIVTVGKFSQKYGHFEARIKVPSAAGTWPAFWMLADSTAWPATGEIDIEECANKNPVKWFGTLHYANAGGGHLAQGFQWNAPTPLSDDYHLYAADWTTDSISFYIDNTLRGTVSKTALVAGGGVWPFDSQKFYIIINLAVGGQFTGQTPDPTQFPQSMLVDYVRVYSKAPCTITQPPVISSPATATGTQGVAITNYTIVASNNPTSFAVTNLPAGLSLNNVTGVISGVPTVSGTFIDTIKAINAGGTGTSILTFTINAAVLENDLTLKLMMGYQGWFLAQGDNSESNDWRHWFHSSTDPSAAQLNIDLWPDLSEYKTLYPTNMTYANAAPVKLFSSHDSSTTNTHFRWMQQYNIYGVYLQRFLGEVVNDQRFFQIRNDITKNVANAAQTYNRHFAIMYDISGVPDDGTLYSKLVKDWQYLIDNQNIATQSVYVKQNGLPVVAIWGIGFSGRGLKVSTFDSLINYFHNLAPAKYRAYIVGGVPGQWRTLDGDSETDTSWSHVYHSLDMISPWAVGRYGDNAGADNWKTQRIVPDLADCNSKNVSYMPVIFPGFSWKNENGGPLNQIPRNGGNFYWHQAYNAKSAGSNFIYVAMFDEADEGTAMYKAAPTAATAPAQGSFLTLDADGYNCLPSDWYLQLANETQKMLDGTSPTSSTIPINPNRCDTVSIISSGTITEGGAPGTFTIRGSNVTSNITVNYSISGTATSNDYTASPALSGSVILTTSAPSVTLNITALNDALAEPTETLTLTLSAATAYTPSATPATISLVNNGTQTGCSTSMIVNATSVPVIDGTVDNVWSNAPKNALTKSIQGTIQTGSTWQAMYDTTNLYVLVQVKDANKSNVGTNIYDQDGIELFIAGNNNKTGTYTTNDHQYRFNWNVAPTTGNITGSTPLVTTGISYAIPSVTGGYNLEVAIPWTTIGGTAPTNGKAIGFDININDQQNNTTTREAVVGWNSTAADDYNNTADFGTVNLMVCAATAPVITSATTTTGTTGTAFTYTIVATNNPTSYSVTGTLPAGLTVTNNAISGTPTASGTFMVTLNATNAGGTGTQSLTITINKPIPNAPVITSSTTASGTTGTVFSYTIVATNNPTSYSVTGTLPAGLTVTNNVISGTPTTSGTFTVTLNATNAGGTGTKSLTITISNPIPNAPVITSATTATGTTGTAFSYTIVATNNPTSYSVTGTLPAGLTVTNNVISGTPTASGTFTVTLNATNAGGTGTQSLTITINKPIPNAPVITSSNTASGTTGTAFSYTIVATNNPTSYSVTGTLPAGLTVTNNVISGTPTASGTFTVTLNATNAGGTGTQSLTITINKPIPNAPVITSSTTASGTTGTAFSYTIVATNNPTSYSVTGTLPSGLMVTNNVISGTPNASGTFTVTLKATNAGGTGTQSLAITINNPIPNAPVITSATTATGTTGTAFSYTIVATNNPTSYSVTGTLPAGLTVTNNVISGTPTASGTFTVTLNATNAGGTGTQSLTITINKPIPNAPVITSATTATGTTGTAFSYTIVATNNPTSYSVTGTLPAGLTVTNNVISGTPTASGTFTVTLNATNAGGTGTQSLTITINKPIPNAPVITSSTTASGTTGTAFSYTIVATNNPTSYSVTGTLPSGLMVTNNVISGTPNASGTFTVTLKATNAGGTGTQSLAITINNPIPNAPVITSATTATGTTGTAFSYTIVATNNPTSYSVTGTLPAGLTVTNNVISGTPTASGTFTVTLNATNAGGTGTQSLTITINKPIPNAPVITSATTATGTTGTAFSYTIVATNNPTSYSVTGTLPAGLTVTNNVISGTPTTSGTFTVTLNATNAGGTGTKSLTITISNPIPNAPVITSSTTASGTTGTVFSYTIVATNNPTSYAVTGTLPAGLTVTNNVISGTPTASGTFTVTLNATNGGGTGTQSLTITILPNAPVITSSTTASGTTGTAFSYTIVATNNPTSYAVTGTLPAGLTVTNNVISGTPTASGTFTVTLNATNAGGTGTKSFTITISNPIPNAPVITSSTTANGTTGTAFSYTIVATNNPTSYSVTGTLPAGLTVTNNVISGTPTASGTFTVTLNATNAGGTGTKSFTITISNPIPNAPVITSSTTANGTTGTAFTYTIVATNNPTSYSATGLPAGLSINTATGIISGTPTVSGTFIDTIKATNNAGTSIQILSITIVSQSAEVILFPNPVTQGTFEVLLPGWNDMVVNIEVVNFIGKIMQIKTTTVNNELIKMYVPNLIAGSYTIIIWSETEKITRKFIVK